MGQHGENVTGAGFGRWEHRSVGAFSVSGRHSACCHVCPQPLPVPQPQDVELGSPGWPQPQAASSAPAPCNSTPGLPAAGENLQLLYSMNGGKINSEPPLVFCFSTELENSGMHFLTGTNYLLFAFFQASRGRAASCSITPGGVRCPAGGVWDRRQPPVLPSIWGTLQNLASAWVFFCFVLSYT